MKQIVKKFNNLIKRTIFKVQNKTNDNFKISSFNKYLITFISFLFLYIFYLSVPILYDKTWLQTNIEKKLLKEFGIQFSTSSDISYRILPAPHFLIKDSRIFKEDEHKNILLSEIKNLKVFVSQRNFFNKKKLSIKEIVINNGNFSLLRKDFKLLNSSTNNKFSNKEIKINNSNIFFKNNINETVAIIKISRAFLFFDDNKLLNLFNVKGEAFNIPFTFELKKEINSSKKQEIIFSSKALKLNIFDKSITKDNNHINGLNTLSFFNFAMNTQYKIENNLIIFESINSKVNKFNNNYNGIMSINPFDLNLNINLKNYRISKMLNFHSTFTELIKSEMLFNENISVNTSIALSSVAKNEFLQNATINFNITNGKINFDKTKLVNGKIGSLKLIKSDLSFKNNELILSADVVIDIKDSNALFSFLNTKKNSRKLIKNIFINLNYNFLTNQIEFNNLSINNKKVNDKLLRIFEGFNDNNSNNFNKSRRLFNEIFDAYSG